MRVLHIISGLDPTLGGPVTALDGFASASVDAGMTVEVVTTYGQSDDIAIAEKLTKRGITVTRVGPVLTPLQLHGQIKSVVRHAVQRAEIVHIHGLWEDVQHQAARAAQRLGKPYVIRPCGMLDPWSLAQSPTRKRLYLALRLRKNLNRAAAIHFTAAAERDLTASLDLKAPSIIEPNGLDLNAFNHIPQDGTFRQACPELGDRPYAIFLSRVHYKKGLELLIPAFAKAAPPGHALVVAGPGEPAYFQQLKQLAQQHQLRDRVIFTGMVSGPTKLAAYAEADLFVLPSYQDNFGIVVIEALACGTPVLISDNVNIHPEITGAQVGAVSSLEPESLQRAIARSLTNEQFRRTAADRAREFVVERYDWVAIASRWASHYHEMLVVSA